jgi:hypothetical protein
MGAAAADGDQVQRHATQRQQVQAEAEDGAVVCDQHGGAAPQVRRRAAERLIMTADQAAQMLQSAGTVQFDRRLLEMVRSVP